MRSPLNSGWDNGCQKLFEERSWHLAYGKTLALGPKGHLMGVLNVTPDSFSDGGAFDVPQKAADQAQKLIKDGASIVDIGAESTRPGADMVDVAQEQSRLMPAIKAVLERVPDAIISADTYRASTAEKAVQAGAHIINDVWGLQREPDIAHIAADYRAGLVIMHTNRDRDAHDDVIEDQRIFFDTSLEIAAKAGVKNNQIVLDPGFGFGKETTKINVELMQRFSELKSLGFPFLIGTSRKRFLGAITSRDAADRDVATAATTVLLRQQGACVFRVHDVAINADALRVCDAMISNQ